MSDLSPARKFYNEVAVDFKRRVADHIMSIEHNEGLHRSIRFAKPGTMNDSFRLTTWPWHLCISGDMGCFVFSRIEDMTTFFSANHIDLGYWHEKLEATDRRDGSEEFNAADSIDSLIDHLDPIEDSGIIETVREEVGSCDDNAESFLACVANLDEDVRDRLGEIYESVRDRYTFRYVWACYAIAWGLHKYRAVVS